MHNPAYLQLTNNMQNQHVMQKNDVLQENKYCIQQPQSQMYHKHAQNAPVDGNQQQACKPAMQQPTMLHVNCYDYDYLQANTNFTAAYSVGQNHQSLSKMQTANQVKNIKLSRFYTNQGNIAIPVYMYIAIQKKSDEIDT